MVAASLKALVEVNGVPQANAKLREFQANLRKVSGEDATADLKASVQNRGFDEFAAKIDEAKAKTARPITQTLKADYKSQPVQAAIRDAKKLKEAWGGSNGNGGVGKAIGEALTPFGKKGTAIVAAGPLLLNLAGGLTAVAGSAAEAAAGVGALAIGAGGVGAVGLAGLLSVSIPAIANLHKLTSAQEKYTEAVKLYGQHSKEAATALAKLHLAESEAVPAATKVAQGLQNVKERWTDLTKAGQNSFLGIGADALKRFQELMPTLASSANRTTAALREAFDIFQGQVTGKGFGHFIETMTTTFANVVPKIAHGLADWAQILMRIAEAAAPSLERMVSKFTDWSSHLLQSTANGGRLEKIIEGLVSQTMAWVHLLGAAGHLLITVFASGAGEGKRLVEDLTGKLEQWGKWIETHRAQVHEFFHRSAETLRDLSTILGGMLEQWVVFSEAMQPIAQGLVAAAKALNSIKIGNVSALTALLGAYVAARGIGKIGGAVNDARTIGGLLGGRAAASTVAGEAGGAAGGIAGGMVIPVTLAVGGVVLTHQAAQKIGQKTGSSGSGLPGYLETAASVGLGIGSPALGAYTLGNELTGGNLPGPGSVNKKFGSLSIGHGVEEQFAFLRRFRKTMDKLRTDAALGMTAIAGALGTGLQQIDERFARGTKPWRKYTIEAMEGTVAEIRQGMKAGTIPVEEGKKEIAKLLGEIKLVKGSDPFGLAKATVQQFKEVGEILPGGISDWTNKLKAMPKAAQEQTIDATNKMLRAWAQGHPKLEAQLSNLTDVEKRKFGKTNQQLEGSAAHAMAEIAESAKEGAGSFGKGIENIFNNLSGALAAVGATKHPHFSTRVLSAASQYHYAREHTESGLGHPVGKQRGGHINVGKPSGDSVPAMLEKGEYVLNRNAVSAVGVQNLDALNYGAASRFQKGGQAGRLHEPQISGPGYLPDLGQAGLHRLYSAAKKYLAKHNGFSGGVNGGVFGSGKSETERQLEALWVQAGGSHSIAHLMAAIAMAESGGNPHAFNSSGASGLWQIMMPVNQGYVHGSVWNPLVNARAALAILKSQGLGAWETYSTGAYRQYMQAGGLVDPRRALSAADRKRYLANKWKGARLLAGGLKGAAEHELGVPGSHHKAHEHATASDAVHWAMRHLGQSNDYGYPGEWCGAFLAADMKTIGLPVPSGYPAAINWANYGTPLGKNHIQAGAILDYGSAHVAMAVSSSEQIQGNDIHGQVGTSGIGGVIGGSPLTAVRWPPYGTGPGAGSAPTEKVPARFKGVATSRSVPSSIPKSAHGIEKEIKRWQQEALAYHHAIAAAKGRPKLEAALRKVLTKIESHLRQLHRARTKKHQETARKRYSRQLTHAFGHLTGLEKNIQAAQRGYEIANEFASQKVDLEPQAPELPESASEAQRMAAEKAYATNYEKYVNEVEGPAYMDVLAKEGEWRKSILVAEGMATTLEGVWEGQVNQRDSRITGIQKAVKDWQKSHKGKPLPDGLKRSLAEIPQLRFEEQELRKKVGEARGEFYGGRKHPIHPPQPPLVGTGSLETELIGVQGVHWPGQHGPLSIPPYRVAGHFGGAIWETQGAIEELGVKIRQAQNSIQGAGSGGGTGNESERVQLLEELLLHERQRELVEQIGQKTIKGFPYAGGYAAGGIVSALVGEQGPELATFPEGTRITPAHETNKLMGGRPIVHFDEVHFHEADGKVRMVYGDQEFEAQVGKVVRNTRGVGRPTAGGARF